MTNCSASTKLTKSDRSHPHSGSVKTAGRRLRAKVNLSFTTIARAVGQTPQAHDVYLEALYTVSKDPGGLWTLDERVQPERGVYVPAAQIARIDLLLLGDRGTLSS